MILWKLFTLLRLKHYFRLQFWYHLLNWRKKSVIAPGPSIKTRPWYKWDQCKASVFLMCNQAFESIYCIFTCDYLPGLTIHYFHRFFYAQPPHSGKPSPWNPMRQVPLLDRVASLNLKYFLLRRPSLTILYLPRNQKIHREPFAGRFY